MQNNYQVGIIGGGIAGLCTALHLHKLGIRVILWEKGTYPRHKVCGEYVSNESLQYLDFLGYNPYDDGAVSITDFKVSHWNGEITSSKLDQGAFGLSRYIFDNALCQMAIQRNIPIHLNENVQAFEKNDEGFLVTTSKNEKYQVEILISAHGKKSNIDRILNRVFFQKESDYLGVKYHFKYAVPTNEVALHNFESGYCGVSMVENNITNVCYLTTKSSLKKFGNIQQMEVHLLYKNKYLQQIFNEGVKLFEEPKTISDFSFKPKRPIEKGVIMIGDAAGLITPLCGNGMAIAMHGSYLISNLIEKYYLKELTINRMHNIYSEEWNENFKSRLNFGFKVQQLFGKKNVSSIALRSLQVAPFILPAIIKRTHGNDFFKK